MTEHIKSYTGTADWVALSATPLVFKGELTAKSTNGSDLLIRVASDAAGVAMPASTVIFADRWDLRNVEIKGNGLILIATGSTDEGWR